MGANHRITHGYDDHRFHKVIADAFQMIPTPGAGYIISSDAQGNFVWTPAPSGGGGPATDLWKVNTDHQLLQPSTPDPGSSTGGVLYPGIWFPGPTGTVNVTPDTYIYGTAEFRPVGTPASFQFTSSGTFQFTNSWYGQVLWNTTPGCSMVLPALDPAVVIDNERLAIGGGIKIGAALQAADGTLQFTGTKFQGRVAGQWLDIPGAAQVTTTGPNPPTNPQVGQLWWRNTDGNLYVWYDDGNSKQWVPSVASVGTMPGPGGSIPPSAINPLMDGVAAPGIATPYSREDHIHPSDTSRVAKAGDTMTGLLVLSGDPVVALGAATKQYVDSHVASLSPFTEDAVSIHPNNLTKPLYLGATTTPTGTVNDLGFYFASANSGANYVTEMRVAATNPGTNQLAALHLVCGTTEDWLLAANQQATFHSVGFYNWAAGGSPQQILVLNHQGGNTLLDNVQCNFAEFYLSTGIGAGYQSWLRHTKGDLGQISGGASSVLPFTLKAMNWPWPAGANATSRHYHFRFIGTIIRTAGQVTLNVLWGLASGPATIFTWPSGAVSWTNANYYLDVDLYVYLGTSYYCVRMWLTTDPSSQSAAVVATTWMSRGSVGGLQTSSSAQLNITGQFDTSNASNLVSGWAQVLDTGLLR